MAQGTSGRSSLLAPQAGETTVTRLTCCTCAASALVSFIVPLSLCLMQATPRPETLCLLKQAYQVLRHGGVREDNIVVMVRL